MTQALADQAARESLRTQLDKTFFVEASAGTGKTRELVARVVAMVAQGLLQMEGLVAITFTEVAAAELRDRVRQGLAEAASQVELGAEAAMRCTQASRKVDLASIQTIHAFAATLLRTFPLEAGLPPGFAIWDGVEQARCLEDRFRAWLYDEVPVDDDTGRQDAVRRALRLGMTAERLSDLARAIEDRRDCLTLDQRWPRGDPGDLLGVSRACGTVLLQLADLLPLAKNGDADPLFQQVRAAQFNASALAKAEDDDQALEALQSLVFRPPKSVGKMGDWDQADDGRNGASVIKAVFKSVKEQAVATIEANRVAALVDLLSYLVSFGLAYADERRAAGAATFNDLLTWARDLLRDHAQVRVTAYQRFQHVFVDEFQDTDPLQAELVCLLVALPEQSEERDWRKLRLSPGKLFLVGDPKQSIYRFRRADIRIFDEVFRRGDDGSEQTSLLQTFRTVEPIVRWVNHHFALEMQAEVGVQAGYSALVSRPPLGDISIDDAECGVHTVGGLFQGKAPERWQLEAAAVAQLAHQIVHEEWPISARQDGVWVRRPVRYSDICVLLPTRTNLRRIERSLDRLDVPYRMESGSLVLNTQEIRDLLSGLRAVDDPSDQVALVAVLRSPAYGCSDVDLLRWVEAGGRLSYESPGRGCEGPVLEAFASLKRLHQERGHGSPAVIIETYIRERGLALQAFGHPRPRDAWRRVRYMVTQARALKQSGYDTLRSVLDWLEARQAEAYYDAVAAVPDSDEDAIRLRTVHGAKGLEFPVVILTGLGSIETLRDTVHVVVDYQTRAVEVRCGDFHTLGYDRGREQQYHEAEQLRLLYVAATRAREHLVLSLYHEKRGCNASKILLHLGESDEPLSQALDLEQHVTNRWITESGAAPQSMSAEEHATDEATWLKQRRAQIAALGAEHIVTPSSLNAEPSAAEPTPNGRVDDDERIALPRLPRSGSAMGLAVHATLQWLELENLGNLDDLAAWAAKEHGVRTADVARLARRAAESQSVRAIVASGRYWREVPVCVDIDGTLLEGLIDLLYEHEDGSLGVLDYKTDQLRNGSGQEHADHYRLQGGAYALAVERSTGRQVSTVEFLFPSTDPATVVAYDRERVIAVANEARAAI